MSGTPTPGTGSCPLGATGVAVREWSDLDLVLDWQAFFEDPARLLHHLLDD